MNCSIKLFVSVAVFLICSICALRSSGSLSMARMTPQSSQQYATHGNVPPCLSEMAGWRWTVTAGSCFPHWGLGHFIAAIVLPSCPCTRISASEDNQTNIKPTADDVAAKDHEP